MLDKERDVYLQLRDIQTTRAFLPGKIPALAGKAADEIERLRATLRSIINGYEWPKELARRALEQEGTNE